MKAFSDKIDNNYENLIGAIGGNKEELKKLNKSLFGDDRRGGLAKDVNELLQRRQWTDRGVAILIGVLSTLITAFIITRLGIG